MFPSSVIQMASQMALLGRVDELCRKTLSWVFGGHCGEILLRDTDAWVVLCPSKGYSSTHASGLALSIFADGTWFERAWVWSTRCPGTEEGRGIQRALPTAILC